MSLTKKGSLLLAIDGGGTKTHCVVGDSAGNILGEGFGGASNHQVVGTELCASSIKTSIVPP
ncbi:hypothetical protein MASR2M78_21190 [Treponema sp.]